MCPLRPGASGDSRGSGPTTSMSGPTTSMLQLRKCADRLNAELRRTCGKLSPRVHAKLVEHPLHVVGRGLFR